MTTTAEQAEAIVLRAERETWEGMFPGQELVVLAPTLDLEAYWLVYRGVRGPALETLPIGMRPALVSKTTGELSYRDGWDPIFSSIE